jgi:CO dehydrogenase maturation factor
MRLAEGVVDATVVVVEPSPKSIEVGARAVALAAAHSCGRVLVVGNRIRGADDEQIVRGAFPRADVVVVPEDRAVAEADRVGRAPIDTVPTSPAVTALQAVAQWLVPAPA